jgi:hypothetical protein
VHLEQIQRRFEALGRDGLKYRLAPGASSGAIDAAEQRLAVTFPEQVRRFYESYDGIEVLDPPFKLYALDELERAGPLLEFCLCDCVHRLAFDTSEINNAGQWFIVNAETNYRITYTMSSFWSIRMWTWIALGRPIWYDFHGDGAPE